eukprot:3812382-Pyramimonas_sp.AAC.1
MAVEQANQSHLEAGFLDIEPCITVSQPESAVEEVQEEKEDVQLNAASLKNRGPKRRPFKQFSEPIPYEESEKTDVGIKKLSLQDNARRFIQKESLWTKPFSQSTYQRMTILIAYCDKCKDCSKAYAFSKRIDVS